MKLLPSEKDERVKEELPEMIEEAKNGTVVILNEPCDCGSHIRHNNGGNYHQIISIVRDSKDGKWYVKDETTCELNPPAEWYETTEEKAIEALKSALKDGWY